MPPAFATAPSANSLLASSTLSASIHSKLFMPTPSMPRGRSRASAVR
jgi:hypothetical protein